MLEDFDIALNQEYKNQECEKASQGMLHFHIIRNVLPNTWMHDLVHARVYSLITINTRKTKKRRHYQLDLDGSDVKFARMLVEFTRNYEGHFHCVSSRIN